MNLTKGWSILTISTIAMFATVMPSAASLLGANPTFPKVTYQNTSTSALIYNSTSQLLTINSSPTAIQFSSAESPRLITGVKSLQIKAVVDNTGALVGGVTGDDFILSGTVTRIVGSVTNVYSGVLLTGEVTAFGSLESGATDQYDLRFTPTGGALLAFFSCGQISVQVTSEISTFTGSFAANFNGRAKGTVGSEDITPPMIVCPADIVAECNAQGGGLPGAYVTFPVPTVTDNCDANPTVTCTPPSGSFFALSPNDGSTNYLVTCVARDASGNTNLCTFIVTIQDTMVPEFADTNNPIISSPDLDHPLVLTNDPGKCYSTFTFMRPLAVDNCCPLIIPASVSAIDEHGAVIVLTDLGNDNLGNDMLQGQFPVNCGGGSNLVTVTASDLRGNTSQHQCAIKVIDTEAPVIVCTSDQTVSCMNGPVFFQEPTASDNCAIVTVSLNPTNGSSLGLGTHLIVATATDCSGNTNQCSFNVTVQDNTAPTVTCPPDVTVECGQSTAPGATGQATAIDSCDQNPTVSFTDSVSGACPKIITRTWKATDATGNQSTCTQTITVQDTTAPIISCPPDKQLQCGDSTAPANTGSATATDSCGGPVTITFTDNLTAANCTGQPGITRIWKATDACGNAATCSQQITFVDTTPPVLSGCPSDQTILSTDPVPPPATVTAADNCSGSVPVTFNQTTNGNPITRTWTATDGCGNSVSCTQTITKVDGCTRTQGYWKNHPTAWPVQTITVGCVTYTEAQAITILQTPPRGDATYILIDQLIAAKLNLIVGANSSCLGTAIADSDAFLCAYALGSKPADPARSQGISLAAILDNYNNGRLACASHCGDDVPTTKPKFNKNDDPFHPDTVNAVLNQTCVATTNGTVNFIVPIATSEYDWNVSVTATPAPGSLLGPGQYTVVLTASDSYGGTTISNFTLTVLSPLRVVFQSPLSDGNVQNDGIPGTDNIANKFKVGQTVVNKVKLYDSTGTDVTSTAAVTVKINAVELNTQNPIWAIDLPEDYSGVGDAGGTMVLTGGAYQFNLNTGGFEAGTVNNGRFFINDVTVYYNSAPGVVVGEEDVQLESK